MHASALIYGRSVYHYLRDQAINDSATGTTVKGERHMPPRAPWPYTSKLVDEIDNF